MYTEKTPAAAPACAVSASACGGHSGSLPGSCGAMAFPFIAAQPDNPPRYNNKEALQQCVNLPDDDAVSHYLRAICLNRADRPIDAYEELKKAFSMDASLKTVATVDGDVNDLLNMDKNN